MLLGVIADDFTGASDIASTLTKGCDELGGLRTTQFLGVPSSEAANECEAGVVSLKSRSMPAADAVAQSLAALTWLRKQGCRQIVFKYCSTFDSTAQGNIGPVGEAIARELGVHGVIACPAFPTTGRTVYRGHLFVDDALLNESGLENHPLTPMTDANIVRWLARQSTDPVGLIALPAVRRGTRALRDGLLAAAGRKERLCIVDAVSDDDLLVIAEAAADAPFLTGASGVALGLPRNFIRSGLAQGGRIGMVPVTGPEAILSGSCSRATLRQVRRHADRHPALPIDPRDVMSGAVSVSTITDFVFRHVGDAPLIYSSGEPEHVEAVQARFGREAVAHRLDDLFAQAGRALVVGGIRRLVVAGGETSGAVVSALSLSHVAIGPEIDPGVPILTTGGDAPLALALKSGNFGSDDFFEKALAAMASGGASPAKT